MPTALIPGGARGIGRAIGLALAKRGYDVAIAWRTSADDAASFVGEVERLGVHALQMRADVTQPDDAARLVEETVRVLGPIEALVHAPGPFHRVELLRETPEGWREMLEGNLSSFFYVSRLVAPHMTSRGGGRMLAFSMVNADRLGAQPFITAHYVAKAGLLSLVRSLAKTLGGHGVTVNAISPGFIRTGSVPDEEQEKMAGRIPAGRVGTVDDVVPLALFLLSDEARYITGADIPVTGGWGL